MLIDNFDSFTYNLVQSFQILGAEVRVIRNNAASVEKCLHMSPRWVVIGPGPGTPSQSGISKDLMKTCEGKIPVLGVCLGHQCLGEVYGGRTVQARAPMHGKTSNILHENIGVFQGLPIGFQATRYHSLIVERETLPECLTITAETSDGEIMGLRHVEHCMEGVQFHPESVLTESGLSLLENFIKQN